mmetsp:Transcript_5769/g.14017  ORF Transcript_5769/g.14017 Transcript_5769/m.14017 type:complete len:313 (+) Transcript_5769:222-1160(+)
MVLARELESIGANQTITLEQYVESTAHLPAELQRMLNTVKELDERTAGLSAEIKSDVARCLTLVPQSSWKSPEAEQYREVAGLRSSIEERQRKLVTMAEEKVQLAIQCYELTDRHLASLAGSLKELHADELEPLEMNADGGGLLSPEEASAPAIAKRPSAAQLNRKQAEKKTSSEKRLREPELDSAAMQTKSAKRQGSQQISGQHDEAGDTATGGVNKGDANMPSIIEGLQAAADSPQAPGRLLTHADISNELRGRHAELFWPDDNLWYVITIHEVTPMAKRAKIMYTTGETEELDLNEIVREGHMSLINAP